MNTKSKGGGMQARVARAFAQGEARLAERAPQEATRPPVGGAWGKSAVQQMSDQLSTLRQDQIEAVIQGTLPVRIPAKQIDDPLGSDRLTTKAADADELQSLDALVENIRRRGLRVPIRVRPQDPTWRPDPLAPGQIGAMRFVLQSGRRRLEACRRLEIDPLAFLSFVDGADARKDDLQERFFENAARRDLSPVEKLLSIGMIAAEYEGATQAQIAEIVGVSRVMMSRGVALLEHREALERELDLSEATVHEIDRALARLREGRVSQTPDAARKRVERARARVARSILPFSERSFGRTRLELRSSRNGELTLTIKTVDLDPEAMGRIAALVEELASRDKSSVA